MSQHQCPGCHCTEIPTRNHLDGGRATHKVAAEFNDFAVITIISNPVMYRRRYELYWKFKQMCESAGVRLITVELQQANRDFMVTERDNVDHVQLRTVEELWFKENMINVGIRHVRQIHPHISKVAWVDADCFPMTMNPREWFAQTILELDTYEFVQMWEHMIDFGPQGQPISKAYPSFMACYANAGFEIPKTKTIMHTLAGHSGMIAFGRPGLAWAANVSALDKVGGLIDFCILGSGDWHMAHGLVNGMTHWAGEFKRLSQYSKKLLEWQELANRHIRGDVGYVRMTVGHEFHGKKSDRKYGDRGQILIKNAYDPYRDIKYDTQGLLQLETWHPRQIRLRDFVRGYFRARNEDSIDL